MNWHNRPQLHTLLDWLRWSSQGWDQRGYEDKAESQIKGLWRKRSRSRAPRLASELALRIRIRLLRQEALHWMRYRGWSRRGCPRATSTTARGQRSWSWPWSWPWPRRTLALALAYTCCSWANTGAMCKSYRPRTELKCFISTWNHTWNEIKNNFSRKNYFISFLEFLK